MRIVDNEHKGNRSMKDFIDKYRRERDGYFGDGIEEIEKENLNTLLQASGATMVVACVLMILTPFIVTGWVPSLTHIILVPVIGVFFFVSLAYQRKEKTSNKIVNGMCLLYIACLFLFVIQLDVFQYPHSTGSFMEAVIIVVPALFVFRFRVIFTEIAVFEVIYIICTFYEKEAFIAQNDIFNSIVGLMVSIVVALIVQHLRAESYQAQVQYRQLSMNDELTGMMDKANCEDVLRKHLEERMPLERCALFLIDIDNFERLNQKLGRSTGDMVLNQMGTMLVGSFRTTDVLGRIGGDEFVVLMRGISSEDTVKQKCNHIFDCLEMISQDIQDDLSCSIGIAILQGENTAYEEVLQVADDALYEAKASGKGRYAMHYVNGE